MTKYYTYECTINEIDTDIPQANMIFHVHSLNYSLHNTKQNAFKELRDILNSRCDDNAASVSL